MIDSHDNKSVAGEFFNVGHILVALALPAMRVKNDREAMSRV
jgi:hypothetical protein